MVYWPDVDVRLLELGSTRILLVELLLLVRGVAPGVSLIIVLEILAESLPLSHVWLVSELGLVGRHGWWVVGAAPVVQDGPERVLLGFIEALLELLDGFVVREQGT